MSPSLAIKSNRNLEQITVDLALVETHFSGIQENYNPKRLASFERKTGGLAAGKRAPFLPLRNLVTHAQRAAKNLTPSPRAHIIFPAAAAAVFIHGSLRTAADLETARPCFRSGRLRFLSDRKPAGLDVRGAQGPRHRSLLPAERRRDPRPRRYVRSILSLSLVVC